MTTREGPLSWIAGKAAVCRCESGRDLPPQPPSRERNPRSSDVTGRTCTRCTLVHYRVEHRTDCD